MKTVQIGRGKLAGKGIYAARDIKKGELVTKWVLKELSQSQFDLLPKSEHMFVHSFWGKMYLFGTPERYTNHSATPNTIADYKNKCDYAARDIKRGEMITTNATQELLFELKTIVQSIEKTAIHDFQKIKGGYRNAVVKYTLTNGVHKTQTLKRMNGNWQAVKWT